MPGGEPPFFIDLAVGPQLVPFSRPSTPPPLGGGAGVGAVWHRDDLVGEEYLNVGRLLPNNTNQHVL